jgi:adenosine deaminase
MNWKIYLPLLFFMNVSLTWASFHQTFHNEDDKFGLIHDLPKVELHAHLHGSVRHSTLQELIKGSDKEDAQYRFMLDEGDHGLADRPFDLFPVVHKLVNSIEIVKRVLHEMVEDYIAENVIYLEIRTTPRSLPDGTTAREYVKTLVSEIAAINQKQSGTIHTRLILSIDRSKKVSDGEDVLSLAKEFQYHIDLDTGMKRKVIVGIDFSGNPNGGRFDDFAKIFEDGRNIGFNITLHTAEIAELSETETDHDEIVLDDTTKILNFK